MLEQKFLYQKDFALRLRTEPLTTRLEHLESLEKMIQEHIPEIVSALEKDFAKPKAETLITEIYPLLHEIRHTKKNLRKWMRPERVKAPLLLFGTKNHIVREPRGVCLIIGPWNYPFQLIMGPLIAALAAGNCAFLKPSEYTSNTSGLIARLIQQYFSEEHIAVVEGGVDVTQELLKLPFDHIFFTGSTAVGKIIMEAASKHLSSVTLELGGKSPTIVDSTANLEVAAEKIAWAKFINASQTCVAPDYVFVQESIYEEFKTRLIKSIERFYGPSPEAQKATADFARMISQRHTQRVQALLSEALEKNATLVHGGHIDIEKHYVSPTVIENVDLHSKIMKEEIFAPLLPLIPYKDISHVIHFINDRPKPLALYIYSHSEMNIQDVIRSTSSGGLCINDSVVHLTNPHLPFGGVGESGIGSYHGYHGFKAFSHEKAVLRMSTLGKLMRLIYPPYTGSKIKLFKQILRWKI